MNGYPNRSCTNPEVFGYFTKFNVRNHNFTNDTPFLGGTQHEQPRNYSLSSSTSTSPATSPRHEPVYNSAANNFYINEHPKTHTNTSQALPAGLSNLVHFPSSSLPGFLPNVYNNIGFQHPTAQNPQIQSTHAPAPYPSQQVFYVKPSATSPATSRTASPEDEILESSDPSIAEAAIHQITFDLPPTNYPTQFISSFTSSLSSDLAQHTTGNFTECQSYDPSEGRPAAPYTPIIGSSEHFMQPPCNTNQYQQYHSPQYPPTPSERYYTVQNWQTLNLPPPTNYPTQFIQPPNKSVVFQQEAAEAQNVYRTFTDSTNRQHPFAIQQSNPISEAMSKRLVKLQQQLKELLANPWKNKKDYQTNVEWYQKQIQAIHNKTEKKVRDKKESAQINAFLNLESMTEEQRKEKRKEWAKKYYEENQEERRRQMREYQRLKRQDPEIRKEHNLREKIRLQVKRRLASAKKKSNSESVSP